MKFVSLLALLLSAQAFGWGNEGHQVVGALAELRLDPVVKEKILKIAAGESLAKMSTWADVVKGTQEWEHSKPWHFVNIPDGLTYEQCPHDPEGDVVAAINQFTADLKDETLPLEKRKVALQFLVHFIGDIHQPLHAGRAEDLGGNLVKVFWRNKNTNLHAIWDTAIVKAIGMNSEILLNTLNNVRAEEAGQWGSIDIATWIKEDMDLRKEIYNLPETRVPGWEDAYERAVIDIVKSRLQKAGVRLALFLNANLGK